jgi:cytochrome c-type protein NapC
MSIRGLVQALRTPSTKYSLGALLAVGLLAGAVAVPTFVVILEETSTDEFCLKCHARDIGLEMSGRPHNDNFVGYRVSCAECHIPHDFVPKVLVKAETGVKDIVFEILGTINTPEKFEANRMRMALSTWEEMNHNDSRECRYCHDQTKWDPSKQSEKAQKYHAPALSNGKTCINCHKGIAHELPKGIGADHQVEALDF